MSARAAVGDLAHHYRGSPLMCYRSNTNATW